MSFLKNRYTAFFLLILGLFWLGWQFQGSHTTTKNAAPPAFPDAYMENVVAVQTDATGALESRVIASHVEHMPTDNTSYITQPVLYSYSLNAPPWKVSADQARAVHGFDIIYLTGHVIAYQTASSTAPSTTILTDTATVYPADKIAETKDNVTFIQPGTEVHSVGARANMRTGEVNLLSKANAIYQPTTTPAPASSH